MESYSEKTGMTRRFAAAGLLFVSVPALAFTLRHGVFDTGTKFDSVPVEAGGLVALGALFAILPLIPTHRGPWLRHPGLLAYGVINLILIGGRLLTDMAAPDGAVGHHFWIFMIRAQLAGVVVALLARKAASEIRSADNRLLRMARASSDGLWSYDMRTNKAEWDGAFGVTFGYSPEQISSSLDWWRFRVHPDDIEPVMSAATAAMDDPHCDGCSWIYRFRKADGKYAWVLDRCVFERTHGKVERIYGGLIDISERMHIEDELRRRVSERTRELASLTYSVTHDLKSPLASIFGYGELLAASGNVATPESRAHLEKMLHSATRMSEILDDLLARAREETEERHIAPVQLDEIFSDLNAEFSFDIERAGGRLTLPPPPAAAVHTSRTLVYRVLQNLVGNAIKYARAGVPPEVRVEAGIDDRKLVIAVSDNGIGINKKDTPGIFNLGARTAAAAGVAGHGVGLYSVSQAVKRLGGRIIVESAVGEGSRFTVEIPISPRS